jgi:predicted transposase/invertase (TIGR01784 family)
LTTPLEAVLQPSPDEKIEALQILNPFNEKEALDDKLSVLDIKVRDQTGRQFNVEMQLLTYGAFRQRALYYWARLHQGQLQEAHYYHELRPTVGICFVDTPLFPETPSYHLVFELREREHGVVFTDQLAVHILELPKFTKPAEALMTPLDRWLYFLRHGQDLDAGALPETLAVPEIERALGDLTMMTQSDLERERYESRLKAQRDFSTAMETARRYVKFGRLHAFQRLLDLPLTPEEGPESMTTTQLDSLADQLEAEIRSKLRDDARRDASPDLGGQLPKSRGAS